jgi:hypothetical protein
MPCSKTLEYVVRNPILSILILLAPLACRAADDITPLGVKPGLWESTVTLSSGVPAIPPEALAQLTPEQRARIEAQMNTPHTSQACYTSESLKKPLTFGDRPNSSCKSTVTSSSTGALDFHIDCDNGRTKSSGDAHIRAVSPESIKGEIVTSTIMAGRGAVTSKVSFSSRWIGSDCGNVKPK